MKHRIQFLRRRRREFITLLGGVAAAWPSRHVHSRLTPCDASARCLLRKSHVDLWSLPLRQYLVRARLAVGTIRNPGSRLHLLILREAWRCLDLLPDRIAHGERQGSRTRVKIRVRHQDCGVSRGTACGVVPVVTSRIDGRLYAVVSVNAFENVEPALLRRSPATFEGENEQAHLSRRKRNWIADVQFDAAS
jgi:hypothetical protein